MADAGTIPNKEIVAAILTIALRVTRPRTDSGPVPPARVEELIQDYTNVFNYLSRLKL
jgi:hypothetical protein